MALMCARNYMRVSQLPVLGTMHGKLVQVIWLDRMSCRPTTKAARSMKAGSNLCQGTVTPGRADHGNPKGQHRRRIPCRSQVLCTLCLLTCAAGMWRSKGSRTHIEVLAVL